MKSNESLATALATEIVENARFQDAIREFDFSLAKSVLTGTSAKHSLDHASWLVSMADVLAHSDVESHRELAYQVVASVLEADEHTMLPEAQLPLVHAKAGAVLSALGNFPGLGTLSKRHEVEYGLPESRGLEQVRKEIRQRTATDSGTFTDAQFRIVEKLRTASYFSFSGPTSLGKSFILKDHLFKIMVQASMLDKCAIVLVPTKALIAQTSRDLRRLFIEHEDINIATYPVLPRLLREKFPKTIFVFTPERLLRYLTNPLRDIAYLVVDEAQKIVSEDDSRSSLYFHAIGETLRSNATKLVFASPSIANPELFLQIFQRSETGSIGVNERAVAQQRYFVDLLEGKQSYFSTISGEEVILDPAPSAKSALQFVKETSRGRRSLVYINSSSRAALTAMRLAADLPTIRHPILEELAEFASEFIHKQFYLVETLKKGVAFHHGKIPQELRERIEEAFRDQSVPLNYIVCTSTLLEGVNLPAKNIFVLDDQRGMKKFDRTSFDNLIGRAGRLSYDFSGNIFVLRSKPSSWVGKTENLLERKTPEKVSSFLVNPGGHRKMYTDIEKTLRRQPLPKNRSNDAKRTVQQYTNILLAHHIEEQVTPLRTLFLERIDGSAELLRRRAAEVLVPQDSVRQYPDISIDGQNRAWEDLVASKKPLAAASSKAPTFDNLESALNRLNDVYTWQESEGHGTNPLLFHGLDADGVRGRLRYWAMLMSTWVRGDSVNQVIRASIRHHLEQPEYIYYDYEQTTPMQRVKFNRENSRHVNEVIEETLKDIDGGLRFRIISYLQHHWSLSKAVLGEGEAGFDLVRLVEYGTSDERVINLQDIGLSRSSALQLIEFEPSSFVFDSFGEVTHIDYTEIGKNPGISDKVKEELLEICAKLPEESFS